MKMILKPNKIVSFAAAVLMALTYAPAMSVSAASSEVEDELTDGTFTYEMGDNGYTIVDCDASAIITDIPAMRNGYAIVAVGEQAFAGCSFITELTIPETVKSIGSYAFAGCTSLKTLNLPSTIKEIPDGAFNSCAALTELDLPEGIESVGMLSFAKCEALETVKFPDSLTSIGSYAFQSCYSLKEINIPSGVESIDEMAFLNCASVEKITADSGSAFTAENNVLYNKDKTVLYRAAAYGTDENFYVPDTVTSIGGGAFSYCTELSVLFIPSSVTKIGQEAFIFCTGLSHIDFSEGLTEIGAWSFAHCTALTSLSLPTTLKTIGESAFFDAAMLEKVIMTEGVETIGAGAFSVCDYMKNIIIPQSVNGVGEYALGYTVNSDGTDYEKLDGFSMSVYSGSAAEKYAKTNDIDYTVVDKSIKKTFFVIAAVIILITAAVCAVALMRRGRKLAPSDVRKAEADADEEETYEGIIGDDEE